MESMASIITNIFKFMETTIRFHKLSIDVISIKTSAVVGNLMEDMVNFREYVFRLMETTIHCHKLSICP